MYVCVYVCKCVHVYVRTYVRMYVCTYVHAAEQIVHTYMYVILHAYICLCVHMYVRTYVICMYVSVYICMYIHTYVRTHVIQGWCKDDFSSLDTGNSFLNNPTYSTDLQSSQRSSERGKVCT